MATYFKLDENNVILGLYAGEDDWDHPEDFVKYVENPLNEGVPPHHGEVYADGLLTDTEGNIVNYDTRRAQFLFSVRVTRQKIFQEVIDPIMGNYTRWNELTEEQQQEWVDYRQAWLDITDAEDLRLIVEPDYPSTYTPLDEILTY